MNFKILLTTASMLGMAATTTHASLFTIQEGAITGTPNNLVTADQGTFRYEASVVQTHDAATNITTFNEKGWFDGTGFVIGNAVQSSWLNSPEPNGYGIYGLFEISGTITFAGTTALATFDSGWVEIWADPNQNTTKTIGAGDAVVTLGGTTTDDLKLGSAQTLLSGQANIPLVGDQAASGGSFVATFGALNLTATGENYFIDPSPFYLEIFVSGENERFNPVLTSGDYTGLLEGDGSYGFRGEIPEPMSLALLGIGLLGLGITRRKQKALN